MAFATSADLLFNPALPIGLGTIAGFISTILNAKFMTWINNNGIIDLNGTITSYLFPGIISSIASAIIIGAGAQSAGSYTVNISQGR